MFERRPFRLRFVFVCSGDLTAELSDDRRFAKHLAPGVEALRSLAGDGLFTAFNDEPNWRHAHELLAPAFTQSAMRAYHATMLDVTADLLAHWDRRAAGDGLVDVAADMTKLTLETIGRTGFSYSFSRSSASDRTRSSRRWSAVSRSRSAAPYGGCRSSAGTCFPRRNGSTTSIAPTCTGSSTRSFRTRQADGETGHDDLLELMLRAARERPEPHR